MEARNNALKRIHRWYTPPNYSAKDWTEEMQAHGSAAAWQAQCDFDPKRDVPLPAFVYQRVLARALTRYRQEWTYGARCPCALNENTPPLLLRERADSSPDEPLRLALARLGAADRQLIERLFWTGASEAALAREMGVSQHAVSKRKQATLRNLRRDLDEHGTDVT
jgi:DNA-directed RNA polymerase specialized sigma24 family protein